MAKNSIADYSATAASNTDIQSVDIDEGCAPSGINNAIRELMADLADMNAGTTVLTSPSASVLTLADGSSSAPALANTGDTNTGIFFPAADTVGVAVGGTEVWRYGSNPTTGKNLIINGAMTVAQRGTSFTALADAYCLDRWIYTKDATTAVIDVTQSTDVPAGEGFGKSVKIDVTTADSSIAATDLARFQTRLEAQNLTQLKYGSAGAQTMTLSFWIKSTKTGTFSAFAFQPDGSRFYNASYTVNVSNTWEYKTVTITGDSGGTINDDTGAGLIVGWTLIAGTNWTGSADTWSGNTDYAGSSYSMLDNTSNDILITGVQLEVGSVATDFEFESFHDTRQKCLRYFNRLTPDSIVSANLFIGFMAGVNECRTVYHYPVKMRAAPSVTFTAADTFEVYYNNGGAAQIDCTSVSASHIDEDHCAISFENSTNPFVTGEAGVMRRDATDTTRIDFAAEL